MTHLASPRASGWGVWLHIVKQRREVADPEYEPESEPESEYGSEPEP